MNEIYFFNETVKARDGRIIELKIIISDSCPEIVVYDSSLDNLLIIPFTDFSQFERFTESVNELFLYINNRDSTPAFSAPDVSASLKILANTLFAEPPSPFEPFKLLFLEDIDLGIKNDPVMIEISNHADIFEIRFNFDIYIFLKDRQLERFSDSINFVHLYLKDGLL